MLYTQLSIRGATGGTHRMRLACRPSHSVQHPEPRGHPARVLALATRGSVLHDACIRKFRRSVHE